MRRSRRAFLAGALLAGGTALACSTTPAADPDASSSPLARTARTLAQGTVVGTEGLHGGHAWLGIPFALPPIGERRWRAPEPPAPFEQTLEATRHAAPCVQFASPMGGIHDVPEGSITGREDCLTLDIYAPPMSAEEAASAELPVMFWIHGGGNTIGTSHFYDGSRLAAEQRVIVVAVQYRLGVFGWFRHPRLHAGAGPLDASGNFGTLDLIRGLEWTRDHIAAFGGSPDNVTIFGESAGGQNVLTLVGSPLATGLFHRAIVQSGGAWGRSVAEAENLRDAAEPGHPSSSGELVLRYLQDDGLATDRDSARARADAMSADELGAYLRGKSSTALMAALEDDGTGMIRIPRVFRDGTVLPTEPIPRLLGNAGRYNRVPMMLGSNRDENKLFLLFDDDYVRRVFQIVPIFKDEHAFHRDGDRMARAWKLSGVDQLARRLVKAQPGEVYAYRWDWDEEPRILWTDLGEVLGAAHGFEIPFVFGHFDLGPLGNVAFDEANAPGREALSAAMRAYWAEFARSGSPGGGGASGRAAWGPWTEDADKFLVLDTPADGGIRMTAETERATDLAREILSDESYGSPRRQCMALAVMADETRADYGEAEYRAAAGGRCAQWPMDGLLDDYWGG